MRDDGFRLRLYRRGPRGHWRVLGSPRAANDRGRGTAPPGGEHLQHHGSPRLAARGWAGNPGGRADRGDNRPRRKHGQVRSCRWRRGRRAWRRGRLHGGETAGSRQQPDPHDSIDDPRRRGGQSEATGSGRELEPHSGKLETAACGNE